MKPRALCTFTAIPSLPPALERLRALAYNVRWAWHADTLDLFRRLGDSHWSAAGNNPVKLLGIIPQSRLQEAAEDEGFLAHLAQVCADYDIYMRAESTWCKRHHGAVPVPLAAYFSAEFGITECLPIFAGGLGVLAGDHLKSASDLGVPLVGMGLLYQQGYFRQRLGKNGWQHEIYEANDPGVLPINPACDAHGKPVVVSVSLSGHRVHARVWQLQVGRVPLYLLDTNFAANTRIEDRNLTDYLYGGDNELRIRQEVMLGIGGYRALKALGLSPRVYHINEGHSAFLTLEHIHDFMQTAHLSFAEASIAASASTVFTTHTPVEAGHDRFPAELMDRYLTQYAERALGLSRKAFLALGRQNPDDERELFGMTKLALRMSAASNGVARLHGEISRKMWQRQWPSVPKDEVPIGHITNGMHASSWCAEPLKRLLGRYLGPRWHEGSAGDAMWARVHQIPDSMLWRTHVNRRERLITVARQCVRRQLARTGASQSQLEAAAQCLDPNALTIGFARRFATYKRATLLLKDPARLARILGRPERPVQVIFAGKAHPRDEPGKRLIQEIVALSRTAPFSGRIVFLEDYDMNLARYLVQGADLWLNTPRRPREASGTSGMKAAANGVLNLSILDGWWDEAYDPALGWAIGTRTPYNDHDYQDARESSILYDILEQEVVPLFYARSTDDLPSAWIARMKGSIATYSAAFSAHRMVRQYVDEAYLPAARRYDRLANSDMARTRALAAWWDRVHAAWSKVRVSLPVRGPVGEYVVGQPFAVEAYVELGSLTPDDVEVQLCLGSVTAAGEIENMTYEPMSVSGLNGHGAYVYEAAAVACQNSGFRGYTVRVLPRHKDLGSKFLPGLVAWGT